MSILLIDNRVLLFPNRPTEFINGVEIGLVLAALETETVMVERWIRTENQIQVRALVSEFGYRVTVVQAFEDLSLVLIERGLSEPENPRARALRLASVDGVMR